jgi:hypothetical protein
MAISAETAQKLSESLGLSQRDMTELRESAVKNGSATGYTDVEGSPMCGVLITVHHAGDGKFMIELH